MTTTTQDARLHEGSNDYTKHAAQRNPDIAKAVNERHRHRHELIHNPEVTEDERKLLKQRIYKLNQHIDKLDNPDPHEGPIAYNCHTRRIEVIKDGKGTPL